MGIHNRKCTAFYCGILQKNTAKTANIKNPKKTIIAFWGYIPALCSRFYFFVVCHKEKHFPFIEPFFKLSRFVF